MTGEQKGVESGEAQKPGPISAIVHGLIARVERLLGIPIERKVDLASIVAVIVAMAAMTPQVIGWFKKSTTTLLMPPQVILAAEKTNSGARKFVRVGARMAYFNDGDKGTNVIIMNEVVAFEMEKVKYAQLAHAYGKLGRTDDLKFKIADEVDAIPTAVEGGSLISHESYFAPYFDCDEQLYPECSSLKTILYWDEFLKQIKQAKDSEQRTVDVNFIFSARSYDHKHDPEPVKCKARINTNDAELFEKLEIAPLTCKAS